MGSQKKVCDDCRRIIRSYGISFFFGRYRCHICQIKYSKERRQKLINGEVLKKQGENGKLQIKF